MGEADVAKAGCLMVASVVVVVVVVGMIGADEGFLTPIFIMLGGGVVGVPECGIGSIADLISHCNGGIEVLEICTDGIAGVVVIVVVIVVVALVVGLLLVGSTATI